jgi:Txe/YoeB family toxin of Txe-Axe toxin-antitoxin module
VNQEKYKAEFTEVFNDNLNKFSGLKKQIQKKVNRILINPYYSEFLSENLIGCRSIRVTRNFRILFVICEECIKIKKCKYCFCEGLPNKTVIFLTVNTHQKAYEVK